MFNKENPGLKVLSYNVLRVVAGLLFAQHGAQKLFGVLEGNQASLASLMGLAGIIEFVGGLLIAFGLFTRPVAFIACGQMAVAYFMTHAPQGFWPILNRGELAAFYCFTWLFFFTHGPGKYSVDGWLACRKAEAEG